AENSWPVVFPCRAAALLQKAGEQKRGCAMELAHCLIGLLMAGFVIVFNEPVARASHQLYSKLFHMQFNDADLKRSKLLFVFSGTVLIVMNSIELRSLLIAQ